MATAEELLSGLKTVDKTFVISNDLRTISIPPTVPNLGVESDNDVLQLQFKMPRYIGDIDLSTFGIRINYVNASGESDVYTVRDPQATTDYISFSWLVGPTATRYKGETRFNVCLVTLNADGYVEREFNTTVATMKVLEGLEVDESLVEEYSDLIEQWRRELFGIGDTEEASIRAASQAEQEAIANEGARVLATIPVDYQTAVSMTDNADRTKADAIICSAKGDIIQVSDSSDDYLRGLKIFGKTTQLTTTGKNLLNIREITASSSVVLNDDGSLTVKTGNYSISCLKEYTGLLPAGTYTFSNFAEVQAYIVLTRGDYTNTVKTGKTFTFTYDGHSYLRILFEDQEANTTITYKAQLELGSTATSYEPYTGGAPSPRPDYPQELYSVGDSGSVAVNVTGKNLWTRENVVLPTAAEPQGYREIGMLPANVPITISADITKYEDDTGINTKLVFICWYTDGTLDWSQSEEDTTNSERDGVSRKKWTTLKSDPNKTIRTWSATLFSHSTCDGIRNAKAENIQVEIGSTPTEYEPYQSQSLSASTQNSLPGIPVSEGGNYTDSNGQQWICDEIDFERGVYIQRVGAKVFDGSADEKWSVSAGQYYITIADKRDNYTKVPNALRCSHFRVNPTMHNGLGYVTETYYASGNRNILVNLDHAEGGVDNFVTWLQSNPITVQYVLATPIETPLTQDEIQWFRLAHTNCPNTTVLNDAGAMMELKYNADTKTYLDNCSRPTPDQVNSSVNEWLEANRDEIVHGADGEDGVSVTHSWNGTVLTVTSASGTSSADLKGYTPTATIQNNILIVK